MTTERIKLLFLLSKEEHMTVPDSSFRFVRYKAQANELSRGAQRAKG